MTFFEQTERNTQARILKITKDDMTFCSSRVIMAELEEIGTGKIFEVQWAHVPSVDGISNTWKKLAVECFDRAWACEVGDEVTVYPTLYEDMCFFDKTTKS